MQFNELVISQISQFIIKQKGCNVFIKVLI